MNPIPSVSTTDVFPSGLSLASAFKMDPKGADSPFMKGFYDKGRVSGLLKDVPVYAVLVEDIGLRGAHFVAFRVREENRCAHERGRSEVACRGANIDGFFLGVSREREHVGIDYSSHCAALSCGARSPGGSACAHGTRRRGLFAAFNSPRNRSVSTPCG